MAARRACAVNTAYQRLRAPLNPARALASSADPLSLPSFFFSRLRSLNGMLWEGLFRRRVISKSIQRAKVDESTAYQF